jgi:LPS export ABC transporter permease LptG/LPS export ABC transporter permease LptF
MWLPFLPTTHNREPTTSPAIHSKQPPENPVTVRILTKYILREVITYALLGGVLFTFVLFMRYLLTLMELAVRGSASVADVAQVTAFLLPNLLTLTIPMAVLIGILLGLSRLASDSEITAMRACGMGVTSFIRIVIIFASFAFVLGLANTLYVAPHAARSLLKFDEDRKNTQASFAVQPRVFYEGVNSEGVNTYVLYVQDVLPAPGAAVWRHVFLADLTEPATPHITTADEAIVVSDGSQTPILHLTDGSRHDVFANNPDRYDISTFKTTDVPMQSGQQEDAHITRRDTPLKALDTRELFQPAPDIATKRAYAIELNSRFAFPAACFVLMLVGVPLGLSSNRGGKGTGFVLTLFLVILYYVLSEIGIAFATQGKLSPFLGVWGANILFTAAGLLLVQQLSRGGVALSVLSSCGVGLAKLLTRLTPKSSQGFEISVVEGLTQRVRRILHIRFPLILDEYVMRSFVQNFVLVLASLSSLFLIFTFFELIGDIIKYSTPLTTVVEYLVNLVPFILYNVTPMCSLVAVLITFGALSRTSELTAMKATGISIYRVIAPVLLVALLLSVALFAFDEGYLPAANRRQDALRSVIKGKPAQTFLRPDRKWMSGQTVNSGEPTRIFYYQFFDPDKAAFANLTVFEFQPGTFRLQRRIFASSVHWDDHIQRWVFENGWERTFTGETIGDYHPFTLLSFPEIHEQPSYFKKEDLPSQQMSYTELGRYIDDLKQSGFDTMRLRVQLNHKIAYPFITLVMAILAIPFALSTGKKGSLAGMGAAVGVAIAYWVVAGIFENLGNVNSLPAVLAAWSPDLLFSMAGAYLLLRTPT